MKRESNRCRHAAMLGCQTVKCLDGLGVAEHNSDLATTGDAFGLALGAGLGHHELRLGRAREVGPHVLHGGLAAGRGAGALVRRQAIGQGAHGEGFYIDTHLLGRGAVDHQGANEGGDVSITGIHDSLRGGPIPPMSESYVLLVTVSTPFDCAPQHGIRA